MHTYMYFCIETVVNLGIIFAQRFILIKKLINPGQTIS
jgi:hypothetical protein